MQKRFSGSIELDSETIVFLLELSDNEIQLGGIVKNKKDNKNDTHMLSFSTEAALALSTILNEWREKKYEYNYLSK